jgi:hypothetical protein
MIDYLIYLAFLQAFIALLFVSWKTVFQRKLIPCFVLFAIVSAMVSLLLYGYDEMNPTFIIIITVLDIATSTSWCVATLLRTIIFFRFNVGGKWIYGTFLFVVGYWILSILHCLAGTNLVFMEQTKRLKYGVGWTFLAIFQIILQLYLLFNLLQLSRTLEVRLNRVLIAFSFVPKLACLILSIWCLVDPNAWASPIYLAYFADLTVFNVFNSHLSHLFRLDIRVSNRLNSSKNCTEPSLEETHSDDLIV